MPLTALSTYVNCISAIPELLKTLKKSRADLAAVESSFVLRTTTARTFFTFSAINRAKVSWESWNLQGDLKFSFESTSTCPPKQLNHCCQPIEIQQQRVFYVVSRQNIPLLRIQLCYVVRPLNLVSFLFKIKKKPEYRTCFQSNFIFALYLFVLLLLSQLE